MDIPVVQSRFLSKGKIGVIDKSLPFFPVGFSDELETIRVRY